jgi:BirA family biotin operon repressor/biotin-[acetyl-CoA-carboxylase] ligase
MSHAPESLPPEISGALANVALSRLGRRFLYFRETGSTNDVAAALAASGDHEGVVVIADAQTAGRGRRGHTWFSPPGAGLYVSVVLAPRHAAVQQERATALLTMMAGVAIAEAVEHATGLSAAIKWPNDLLVGRRKLSGILAEGVHTPAGARLHSVVLGYGINVSAAAYPLDLADRATSLESELGRAVDRSLVCAMTLAALAARYDDLLAGRYDAILDAWRRRAPGALGARVSVERPEGARAGVTAGVDADGALLVNVGGQIERIVSGEVRWD